MLSHLTQNLGAPLLSTCLSPRQAFDLKAYQVLCKIDAQLRIAGNKLNQMTKACNSAVALGEPVVVNTGLLESVQQLIQENGGAIKAMVANLAKSTVR